MKSSMLALIVVLAGAVQAQTPVERISAEDFGALPFLVEPMLSPDGTRVLARAYSGGQARVVVIGLGEKSTMTHAVSVPDRLTVHWHRWAGDQRILISVGESSVFRGDDVYVTRLLLYDLQKTKLSSLDKEVRGADGDDVMYVDRDGRFLLLSAQRSALEYPSVWRVDLDTLAMKQLAEPWPGVWEWYADQSGVVRAGIGMQADRWWLVYRKDGTSRFTKVIQRNLARERGDDLERLILMNGSDEGYAIANSVTGRYGLYRYNFATHTLGEPIYVHPQVDIDDLLLSPGGNIEAVYYTDDRQRVEWLNPEKKTLQEDLDRAMPGQINRVVSISRDSQTMLMWTGSAADPGRYFVYRVQTGKMGLFARPYERLRTRKLATMESTSYRARDGLEIPAYLTMPLGREPRNLPLMVMPHGGPFARDEWRYDAWTQFLANRGYVVLQPNYRGSTGYGKTYVEKGIGQWGRAMQDDVDDGVKWLVEQGSVDPRRVCIMGASYGGYAAMWAAARNPDIYRCAISFAGVSDVGAMLRYHRRLFSAPRYFRDWRERVQGDERFDLDSVSPLRAVERIRIPLLIAHGDEDETVPMHQSRRLHEALTKAGKPHEYVVYEGEGHGFAIEANSIDFLKRIEKFLATHNPAD